MKFTRAQNVGRKRVKALPYTSSINERTLCVTGCVYTRIRKYIELILPEYTYTYSRVKAEKQRNEFGVRAENMKRAAAFLVHIHIDRDATLRRENFLLALGQTSQFRDYTRSKGG